MDSKSCMAVIVEPRNHPALEMVLKNITSTLPSHWKVMWFHGLLNTSQAAKMKKVYGNRLTLIDTQVFNYCRREYNCLLTSTKFWNRIPAEHILIFQTDTYLLYKTPHKLNTFLRYDYVGAPWRDGRVGNGGLSLRRKSAMLRLLRRHRNRYIQHEDDWTCAIMRKSKTAFQLAPKSVASGFSIETTMYDPHPFGIHKAWHYLPAPQWDQLVSKYPELEQLRSLNGHHYRPKRPPTRHPNQRRSFGLV